MLSIKLLITTSVVVALFSCNNPMNKSVSSTEAVSAIHTGDVASDGRLTVKTASINAKVPNVNQAIQELNEITIKMNGKLEKINISHEFETSKQIDYKLDSAKLFETHTPQASLRISVPKKMTDTFINSILSKGYVINNFDYENKNYFLSNNTETVVENNSSQAVFNNDIGYQSKYLWFDVELKGTLETTVTVIPTHKTSVACFGSLLQVKLFSSWLVIREVIVFLISIWPFWFILMAILLLKRAKLLDKLFSLK